MNQPTLLGRLLSPAGFALVLVFFLLPFVAVSCGPDQATQVTATFSGVDLVIGGSPDITGTGLAEQDSDGINKLLADRYDTQPLAVIAVLLVSAGLAAGLVRRARPRWVAGAALGAAALTALIAAEIHVTTLLSNARPAELTSGPDDLQPGTAGPRSGFYLATIVLALVVVGNGVVLLRGRRHPPTEPPHDQPADTASD